jgi:hypothetical protein
MNAGQTPKNLTRRSRSIPRKLLREGAPHLVALYYLLRLSDLGREGIDRSGSFRFADHIYRGTPSGRTFIGRLIDRRLRRCEQAGDVARRALEAHLPDAGPLRVLSVPCGIPRDIINLTTRLKADNPSLLARLDYHGFDIDPEALGAAARLTKNCAPGSVHYHRGNALARGDYPPLSFHVVISTGLGEFLSDAELTAFYTLVYDVMQPGATFYTSATARDRRSDTLLRMAEIHTHYRRTADVDRILRHLPWSRLSLTPDSTGLQTFITAVK